jgi:outer membrane protein assembly factor BamA
MGDPTQLVRLGFETIAAVGGRDRALVLRGQAAVVQPLAGTIIPFDEMISAAGLTTMRGFPDGRFRDRSAVVGTAEWRWMVASRIDASLFTDIGAVAGPWFADIRTSSFYTSVGAGLRFYELAQPQHWQAGGAWGAQVAYAPEYGFRLMVSAAAF